jgi:hypothetical protein
MGKSKRKESRTKNQEARKRETNRAIEREELRKKVDGYMRPPHDPTPCTFPIFFVPIPEVRDGNEGKNE